MRVRGPLASAPGEAFMLRWALQLAGASVLMAIAGCSSLPQGEIKQFQTSVGKVSQVTNPFFDQLTLAERQREAAILAQQTKTPTTAPGFDVQTAGYFATVGDSPNVETFRASFKVVES